MSQHSDDLPTVGVVGTGELGGVLAERMLDAGHPVLAYDIDPAALERLNPAITRVESSRAVAAQAPYVITCVTDAAAVEDCITGGDGIIAAASGQTLVLEMTTSEPATTTRMGRVLAAVGASIVDAPVSRGVPAARAGTLSVWLGGTADDVARAQPILRPLATDVLHVGPLGSGHTVKAVNMMLMGVNLLATAETAVIARSYGVELPALLEVLNASSGGNFMTSNHFPQYVATGTYASSFSAELMRKDLLVASRVACSVGAPIPFGSRALEIYNMYLAQGRHLIDKDNMRIVEFLAELGSIETKDALDV